MVAVEPVQAEAVPHVLHASVAVEPVQPEAVPYVLHVDEYVLHAARHVLHIEALLPVQEQMVLEVLHASHMVPQVAGLLQGAMLRWLPSPAPLG